ncbi:MAG: hypothetical protein M3R70_01030 [Actinomycetota bacterium]|nr:hypothetical protein [Actinomycetota bacterium]
MRRIALIAAGLVLLLTIAPWVATASRRGKSSRPHTCSATDRQFIETARTNIAALSLWGQEYVSGEAKSGEVISQAKRASLIVRGTAPSDPSLAQTRGLMVSMFTAYAKAIRAKSHARDAGPHMYRAYGLANFAHTVLSSAAAPLKKKGCDVAPLL